MFVSTHKLWVLCCKESVGLCVFAKIKSNTILIDQSLIQNISKRVIIKRTCVTENRWKLKITISAYYKKATIAIPLIFVAMV